LSSILTGLEFAGNNNCFRLAPFRHFTHDADIAAGIPLLTDNHRKTDTHNPEGYFEFEAVKKLPKNNEWLNLASGKAVKIVSHLLIYLPVSHKYKVIFMERDIKEIIISQNRMLDSLQQERGRLSGHQLEDYYVKHLSNVKSFIKNYSNIEGCYISFQNLYECPDKELVKLIRFLSLKVSSNELKKVIKTDLYRSCS